MIYVLATDILIGKLSVIPLPGTDLCSDDGDCGEVLITNGKKYHSSVKLSSANIVIPTAVVRELSYRADKVYKDADVSRRAIKALRSLAESELASMESHYNIREALCDRPDHGQNQPIFTILPIHQRFTERLPFHPAEDDFGGQTILAALTVVFALADIRTDGTALQGVANGVQPNPDVVLLTNDDCLAIRARVRGVATAGLDAYPL